MIFAGGFLVDPHLPDQELYFLLLVAWDDDLEGLNLHLCNLYLNIPSHPRQQSCWAMVLIL